MSIAHYLLIDTIRDHLERRESLEQPGLEPWRCETCLQLEDDCECEMDDAETAYVDSLDAADLMGDL